MPPTGRVICVRTGCRHPRPLHSNGKSGCLARGCHAGPDGGPCPGFLEAPVPVADDRPTVPATRFQPPDMDELAAAAGQ